MKSGFHSHDLYLLFDLNQKCRGTKRQILLSSIMQKCMGILARRAGNWQEELKDMGLEPDVNGEGKCSIFSAEHKDPIRTGNISEVFEHIIRKG